MEESVAWFHALAWCMLGTGAVAFVILVWGNIAAPYGKYSASASAAWGPGVDAQWAWFIQELPCFLAAVGALAAMSTGGHSTAAVVLAALYGVHYTNRALVYPWRIQAGSKTRLSAFLLALAFCAYNGYMQCRFLVLHDTYGAEEHWSPRFLAGVLLFALGMGINLHSDATLRALRTPANPEYDPAVRYYIPRGGAFEFVTGANFFGEILEWAGFALAANSLVAVAFAAFTFMNIGPRGAQHHAWYKGKFEDYPPGRAAVIPFLW